MCGGHSDRYCSDCTVSYCEADYERNHSGIGIDLIMLEHKWTAMETDKDHLKPGETHCIECKKRVATIMCTSCWDPYCTGTCQQLLFSQHFPNLFLSNPF